MKKQLLYILGIIMTLQVGICTQIKAATRTWNGSVNTSWTTAGNWSSSSVPDSLDNIVVNSNAPNNLTLTQNRKVTSFTINGDTLDLAGYTLTVTGTCTFSGGKTTTGIIKPIGTLCHFGGGIIDSRIEANCGYFRMNGGSFLKPTILVSTSYASSTGTGNCIFSDSLTITHSGVYYFTMGSTKGDRFDGPLIIVNSSTHELFLATNDTSYFNNNLIINNISTGGIIFGNMGGVSYLASGKTISIGGSGFTNNYLTLKNFYQLGSTAQTLTLSGTAIVNCINANFNGNLTVTSPGILLKNSTFNGTTTIIRNGSSGNFHCDGGNNYIGAFSLDNAGSAGRVRFANTIPDNFYEDATFNSTGGQDVQIAYSGENNFYGNLTINSNKVVFNTASGKVTFSGDSTQTLNGSYNYPFKKLSVNKTSNKVIANTTLSVDDTLFLVSGNLVTTSTNVITMKAGSAVSGASNNSFVSGPVKKIGATSFVFPVGKSNYYRSASITAPSNATDAFTCEYFDTTQTLGMKRDTSIKFFSDCNYWTILRTTGTSNVIVKLSYDTTFCSMLDSAHLVAVNWNDTLWKNLGNGGITGTKKQGLVANSTSIVKYGKFTLGYTTCQLRANSGSDNKICQGDSVVLGGSTTAINGSLPITYTWKYSNFLSDTTTANPVARPDSTTQFSILITDSLGCFSRDTTTITMFPNMELILLPTILSCYGDSNARVTPSLSGGVAPFSYLWLPDSSTTDSIYNLVAGEYTLVVTDSNSCHVSSVTLVAQPRKIANKISVNHVSCNGKNDGSAYVHTVGGKKPYQYDWSYNGDTTNFIKNVPPGTFYLEVTDDKGCSVLDTIVITEPSLGSITSALFPSDTIFAGKPLVYKISNDEQSIYQFYINDSLIQRGSQDSLIYSKFNNGDLLKVVTSDLKGCVLSDSIEVQIIPLDTLFLTSTYKNYCPGRETPFTISVADPEIGMTYSWYKNGVKIDSVTTSSFYDTDPPTEDCVYSVKANDNSAYGSFIVTVSNIRIMATTNPPSCYEETDGILGVTARGGTGNFEYKLDSGSFDTVTTWEDLAAGSYTVQVQDDSGCLNSITVVVPEVNLETSVEE